MHLIRIIGNVLPSSYTVSNNTKAMSCPNEVNNGSGEQRNISGFTGSHDQIKELKYPTTGTQASLILVKVILHVHNPHNKMFNIFGLSYPASF